MIESDENTMSYAKRLRKNLGLDNGGRLSRMVHFLVRFFGDVRYAMKWKCPECGNRNGHELGCPFPKSND